VHGFAQVKGESVALAQLFSAHPEAESDRMHSASSDDSSEDVGLAAGDSPDSKRGHGAPVEAFIPPRAWNDLTRSSSAPSGVRYVVTGAFEPPTDGRGLLQLLAFEPGDGSMRARVEAHIDGDNAGQSVLAALDELWSQLDGELGGVRDIETLSWEALESVLRAERCALHDPLRGGPHDQLAAMAHLGRAIGDAPGAKFPASRLAALALEGAARSSGQRTFLEPALRALVRARCDAPTNPDVLEAIAALTLRLRTPEEAEQCACEALAMAPQRPRLYAVLSEARRLRGDNAGALEAVETGILHSSCDPLLNTERGALLAARGQVDEAEGAWRLVLDSSPEPALYANAFARLAAVATQRRDVAAATCLIDDALSRAPAHPEVFRRSIQMCLAFEPDGIARAARIAKLAQSLLDCAPGDPWALLVLGRALAQTGDTSAAVRRFSLVETVAPASSFAAEAQRARFRLTEPHEALEVDAVVRAAYQAAMEDLETIAARARGLALRHPTC